jgi:hypothetical protein
MQITRSKTVNETISIVVDFTDDLQTGETITSQSCVASVFTGEDSDPSNILYMVTELHGNKVEQRIRLGIPGVIYSLDFAAVTSASRLLERQTRIAILPNIGTAIPVFIPYYLTSQPYPINSTETFQSPAIQDVSGRLALQPYMGPEYIRGTISDVVIDIYGSGVTYSFPDYLQGTITVSSIDIYGGGVIYDIPAESITGVIAVLSIDIYGSAVSYNIPAENLRGDISVTSITIV